MTARAKDTSCSSKTRSRGGCGFTEQEEEHIQKILGDDDIYLDDEESLEEPFLDSGSEYLPDSESENSSEYQEMYEEQNIEDCDKENVAEDITELEQSVEDFSDIEINWTDKKFNPTCHEFNNANSGIQNDSLTENSKQIDFFLALFTEEIVGHIVSETNRYAQQKKTLKWKDLSVDEFYVFLGITMLMSRNKKISIKEYWSTDLLLNSPIFGKTMPRDRYLKILSNLHFVNNEEQASNRLYKVEAVLTKIKQQFQSQFYPFQNLAVDESIVLFKGRLAFKQYIKTKRHRFGIKLYILCDCETGIVLDFVVYIGDDTKYYVKPIKGLGTSGSIVVSLLEPYLDKGHTIYTDNYYSSPILSNYLFDRQTNSCGTVRQKRKHMPKFPAKLKRGEMSWKSSDKMLVLKWKDRRDVTMITTLHENRIITLDKIDRTTNERQKKPLCVAQYNENMGAVDRTDMMISNLECMRKCTKWYKKLFFHIMDLLLLNAHAMFLTKNSLKVSFADFQLNVIRQIFEK